MKKEITLQDVLNAIAATKEELNNKIENEINNLAAFTKTGFDEATAEFARLENKIDGESTRLENKIKSESARLEKVIEGTAEIFRTSLRGSEKYLAGEIAKLQVAIKKLDSRTSKLEKISEKHSQDLQIIKKDLVEIKQMVKQRENVFAAKKDLAKIEMRVCALENQ